MKSSVIIGSTCHLSICAYSVCWSNVLCFLLCAYNLILACWNIEPKDSTSKSKKTQTAKGVVESMALVLVVEGMVNLIGFIKKRSCQLELFLKDARTHFQVWCIFVGWTSFNLI